MYEQHTVCLYIHLKQTFPPIIWIFGSNPGYLLKYFRFDSAKRENPLLLPVLFANVVLNDPKLGFECTEKKLPSICFDPNRCQLANEDFQCVQDSAVPTTIQARPCPFIESLFKSDLDRIWKKLGQTEFCQKMGNI